MTQPYVTFLAILTVLFILVILYLTYIIIYPKQPINYIKKYLRLNIRNEPKEECTSYEIFNYNNISHYIYYLNNNSTSNITIIDIPGGAFISSSNTLIQYKHMSQPYNVISIEYPVLPDGTFEITIEYITAVIDYLISKQPNMKIILSAASAGCFYAVKLMNLEHFKDYIIKFISTCGYFGYKTLPNIGTYITEKLYLKVRNLIDCVPITTNIKTFFAVAENDTLKISTYAYLQLTGTSNEAIEYENSEHCFYLRYNNEVTKRYYEDVAAFIKN